MSQTSVLKWLSAISLFTTPLLAQPQEPVVKHGNVLMKGLDTPNCQIEATDRSVIHWKNFSIQQQESLTIHLPHEKAALLNRVVGKDPSHLLGKLMSNGKIYLINPQGVVFGKECVINTNGFVASTLNISDDQFLKGDSLSWEGEGAEIVNLGTLESEAGDLILIGKTIRNEGTLKGTSVSLHFKETPLLSIELGSDTEIDTAHPYGMAVAHLIENTGLITAKTTLQIRGEGVVQTGELLAGDSIDIAGGKMINAGSICSPKIAISLNGLYIETAAGHLTSPGGTIDITAQRIFSSGCMSVDHSTKPAGTIRLDALEVALPAARLSAKGVSDGRIDIPLHAHLNIYTQLSPTLPGLTFSQTQLIDPNQGGGTGFGQALLTLPSGYVVVTKPGDNLFASNSGAVYLYNPSTTALLATLTGSQANDAVGSSGLSLLRNGNYLIRSGGWNNGLATGAGAVTWANGNSGISGIVSPSNSLVGSTANDGVGSFPATILSNGNYVIRSPNWDGLAGNVGAVTWGDGSFGITGAVSSSNSLVGTTANDQVGSGGVTVLTNDNYVVRSPFWHGLAANVGAVTWGDGSVGITGTVSSSNSLVGTTANDLVGIGGATALTNGNYVVRSPNWTGMAANVGAITWADGSVGITGTVSSSNSLVGTTVNDLVGNGGVTGLTNGNYVVRSPSWDGMAANVGAITWADGSVAITGAVSSSNSLVGTTSGDQVGSSGITALENGNYVVSSPSWDAMAVSVGAVTWGDGSTGISGPVLSSNSLVGSTAFDQVGSGGVIALKNGNYVVCSPLWDGVAINVGAATWGNGLTGITGPVSLSNSLVGSTTNDNVGLNLGVPLSNGNYVVVSPNWDNGSIMDAGAVTWGDGSTGTTGTVTPSNSLVGSTANDSVGSFGVTALTNGNYVVRSPSWSNGLTADVGALTWGDGATGITGPVSPSNSLVGSTANDLVGSGNVVSLENGNYVVASPNWDNGSVVDAGAATWGNGSTGITGVVSPSNSLVGSSINDQIGNGLVLEFGNVYVVRSPNWDNGSFVNAGAVSIGDTATGLTGVVSQSNSLIGEAANTNLQFPVYSTPFAIVIAGFPGESGSGRVRVTSSLTPVPPSPSQVSAEKLAAGIFNFTRALGNIYQLFNELEMGSLLYAPPCVSFDLNEGWSSIDNCSKNPTISEQ